MTGAEMQIVRIVAEQGRTDTATVARRMGVSAEYIAPRIRSLAECGYLQDVGNGFYTARPRGTRALYPFAGRGTGRAIPVSSYP
jgi:Mn-dependent DtxR family transcriptional regulator